MSDITWRQSRFTEKHEHDFWARLEKVDHQYFEEEELVFKGVLTIDYLSGRIHISHSHLTRLIQKLTGEGTQYLLNDKSSALAKEKISTTSS